MGWETEHAHNGGPLEISCCSTCHIRRCPFQAYTSTTNSFLTCMPQKTGFASWTLHRQSIGVLQAKKRQPNPVKPLPLSGQHRDDSALTSANCADWQQYQPPSQLPPSLNIVMERFVC